MYYPSFDAIQQLSASGKYRRIPLCKELFADAYTPVGVMRILRGASRHCYLLESASHQEAWGRYSFLGYDPTLEITCTDGILRIRGTGTGGGSADGGSDGEKGHDEGNPSGQCVSGLAEGDSGGEKGHDEGNTPEKCLAGSVGGVPVGEQSQVEHPGDAIRKILEDYKSPVLENMPPFSGGLVGYFSYDYIKYSEPKLRGAGKDQGDQEEFRDMDLMLFDQVIAFDHYRQKLYLIAGVMTEDLEHSYARAKERLEEMAALLKNGKPAAFPPLRLATEIAPQFSRETYCGMVERAKHYIREGDIFQIVLSNPMRAKAEGSLFDTYRALRASNPSPYMFYFSSDDIELAGASPETLVKLENGKLSTFPLAGTRPRGSTPQEDLRLEQDLLRDEKELAEHNMLVDLGRNDIGKISRIGTVEVEKYLSVERFSHVMHLGSTVTGQLRPDRDAVDAVDAILPAGTLSGAPKFRACQIIEELECSRRGIYGGAIGYLDFAGNLDTCIAIRLVYRKKGEICIRSGAGIVADSVPEREFEECGNKAGAVIQAIRQAQEGLE